MNLLVGVAVVALLMLLGSLAAAWMGLGRSDADVSPSAAVPAHEPNGDSARSASDRPPVLVRYQMWDASQLPAYRQCASAFMERHPHIRIRIQQVGWGDYWSGLSTGFIAGAAPDVFVNHLMQAPQYMRHGVLQDLGAWTDHGGPALGGRDPVISEDTPAALRRAWQHKGRAVGLPKDWDTVALVVNLDHARRQGVSLDELRDMTWNPQDGGSFERIIKRLTIDAQGRNALDPDFDRRAVVVHGFQSPGPGGLAGQTEWSWLAAANRFELQAEPGGAIRFDDPQLAQAVQWLADLSERGLSASAMTVRSLGAGALFRSGRAAMMPDGSWMSTYYGTQGTFASTWIPVPRGPSGRRASMLNGTADSMWAGSKVKHEAWQWMRFLSSVECQQIVARSGVVFPARLSLADLTLQAHRARGIDSTAFVKAAQEQPFLMPVVDDAARIDDIVKSELESAHLGRQTAAQALVRIDDRLSRLRR